MHREAMNLQQRITDYLSGGGLFNPELANHVAVRDLLIDCRKALAEQPAQPTWVGLTDREVELLDGMIEVQLNHANQCGRMANRVMADKQKGWDMERVELLRKLKEKNNG